jgi:hypothetical protein
VTAFCTPNHCLPETREAQPPVAFTWVNRRPAALGLAPVLLDALVGDKAGKVAAQVTDVVRTVAGTDDPTVIASLPRVEGKSSAKAGRDCIADAAGQRGAPTPSGSPPVPPLHTRREAAGLSRPVRPSECRDRDRSLRYAGVKEAESLGFLLRDREKLLTHLRLVLYKNERPASKRIAHSLDHDKPSFIGRQRPHAVSSSDVLKGK